MNLKIEELKQQIINSINNSGLPIGVVYYLMKNINIDIETAYNQTLIQEVQTQREKEQEGEE